jgi:rRNA small subunit pseudouridine methyltransferase Nep1
LPIQNHTIVLEDASLEIVPKKYQNSDACKDVELKFGVKPHLQILDDNFHHVIVSKLMQREKRGRPDVVHLALLDITSTPLYSNDKVQVVIHTLGGSSIVLGKRIRIPRTLQRFCGVMSKVLAGKQEDKEKGLFLFKEDETLQELVGSLDVSTVISFSSKGILTDLSQIVRENASSGRKAWIVGGFPHGHFSDHVRALSNQTISISESSLPAHVVTARLSYELERNLSD